MLYVNGGDLFDCVQSVERLLQFEAQSIQRPQSHSKPIITLIIDNQCLESISLIPAAYNLQLRCVLLPRSRRHLLPYVQRHTGTTHYIEYRNTDPESFTEPCLDFMEGPYMHSDPIDKNKDQDELTEECKEKLDAAIRAQLGSAGGGFVCMLTSSIKPKIVLLSWDAVLSQSQETFRRLLADGSSHTFVLATSVAHAYNSNGLMSLYYASRTDHRHALALPEGPEDLIKNISSIRKPTTKRCNTLFACPPFYDGLLKSASAATLNTWSIDCNYSAGSPLSSATVDRFFQTTGRLIRPNYGSTETGIIADGAMKVPLQYEATQRTSGYSGEAWAEVRVVPEPMGKQNSPHGLLQVRSPWNSAGYISNGTFAAHGARINVGDIANVTEVNFGPALKQSISVARRYRPPMCVMMGGLRMYILPADLEATYTRILEVAPFRVVVTTGSIPETQIILHIELLGLRCGGDVPSYATAGQSDTVVGQSDTAVGNTNDDMTYADIEDNFMTTIQEFAMAHMMPYLIPAEVRIYPKFPTSPAGKMLLAP